jgi:AcrR family transcriptional regulator
VTTDTTQPRRGRPLDPSREAAILQAALEGLAELGYDRLTMDDIAARARAGKGALYRRWGSKAELVAAAITDWRDRRVPVSIPDTGSLAGDLEAIIASVPNFDEAARQQMTVVTGVATAAARDPKLRAALLNQLFDRPRKIFGEVLKRAVARGEIPADRDLTLIPDLVIGLNMLRVIQGSVPDSEYARRILLEIVYPAVTAPVAPAR